MKKFIWFVSVVLVVYALMWVWTIYVASDRRVYTDDFTRGVMICTVSWSFPAAYSNYVAHVEAETSRRNQK